MPGHAIELREAGRGDAPRLRAWMHALNASEEIEVDREAHARALDRLLGEPTLGRVWIAHHLGEPVGYAVTTFNFDLEHPGFDAFLTELYVVPGFRRQGIASKVLAEVEARLRELDVVALHLAVRPDNAPAIALYEAAGYTPWSRRVLGKRLGKPLDER